MNQKKLLVIGNWKLNPATKTEAIALADQIDKNSKHTAVLAPPLIFLTTIDYPLLAAQDCFSNIKGAYTGQTSAAALASLQVKYCIIGHSERRSLGETDEMINQKASMALSAGLIPVICIGHGTTVTEDDLAVTEVLARQLDINLNGLDPNRVVVAYEPVWAIGSGKSASPEHAEMISLFIQTKYQVPIVLYGGSVNSANASSYVQQPHINGFLVGGASLLPNDFNYIINI